MAPEPRTFPALHPKDAIMPIVATMDEMIGRLARGERLLGLDLGTKTIGMAVSDVERRLASPFETIRRTKFTADVAALEVAIGARQVGGVVIGLPLNMDGSEGPRSQSTRSFVRLFLARRDLPVFLQDERLSTAAVTRSLIEADASRRKRAEVVDRMAAAYILQSALDTVTLRDASGRAGA